MHYNLNELGLHMFSGDDSEMLVHDLTKRCGWAVEMSDNSFVGLANVEPVFLVLNLMLVNGGNSERAVKGMGCL